jgi:hypothetical protein
MSKKLFSFNFILRNTDLFTCIKAKVSAKETIFWEFVNKNMIFQKIEPSKTFTLFQQFSAFDTDLGFPLNFFFSITCILIFFYLLHYLAIILVLQLL